MTERETRIDDMNESKTLFVSGETPFVPGDRDITVPVTRCNGLCHVTRTLSRHTVSQLLLQRQNSTSTPCASNTLEKVFKRKLKTYATHLHTVVSTHLDRPRRHTLSPASSHLHTSVSAHRDRPRLHTCRPLLHTFTPAFPRTS
jgi:hypothetical protein